MTPAQNRCNSKKPLVMAQNKTYSAYDMPEFLKDIGYMEGVIPYNTRIVPMTERWMEPGVPVTCVVGTGIETPEVPFYATEGFDGQPEIIYGKGDGTVNMISMLALESEWADSKSQVLKVIKLPGVSHTSILKDGAALKEIIGEICGINSVGLSFVL